MHAANDGESDRPVKDERYHALHRLYQRLRDVGIEATFDPNELEHHLEPIIDLTLAGMSLSIEQPDEDAVRIEHHQPTSEPGWVYNHTVAESLDNNLVPALLLGLTHPALAETTAEERQ